MALKNSLKKIFSRFRRLTGKYRKLPGFIIIGVQKGGTTSLAYYLKEHPHIYFPTIRKEVHYFDLNYQKGISWYKSYFPVFSKKLAGEATPYYFFHPHVAKRIKKDLPGAKFIVLLREPVSRGYSQYKKEKSKGHEKIESFEAAFYSEKERTEKELKKILNDENYYSFAYQRYTYFSRGLYYKQIQEWFKYFKPEQFLFLKSESLFSNPKEELKKVYKFLGVEEIYPSSFPNINLGKDSGKEPMKPEYFEYFKEDLTNLKNLLGDEFTWEHD